MVSKIYGQKKKSTEIIISDQTGNVRAIWFNQPWLSKTIKPNSQIIISGKVNVFRRRLVFESPEYEIIDGQADFIHTGRLVPIYPSTSGLAQRTIRKIIKQSIDIGINQLTEHIPTKILYEVNLTSLKDAILQIHYPKSKQDWSIARKRLAFDELFLIQLLVVQQKEIWSKAGSGTPLDSNNIPLNQFLNSLPFELTKAQQSALNEILKDISRDRPMRRLLQGDVGSGKTVIALASLLVAVFKGYCGAMMVPTEVLAEQHFTTISSMTDSISVTSNQKNIKTLELPYINKIIHIGLLIGSLTKKEKEELNLKLQKNEIDILIGTHALIQDSVKIPRLALVVIDEQHRFGVNQRSLLSNKGNKPHLLAMSATPIPRSLALTIFGDLDISVINEIPPGRQPIRTRFLEPNERLSAYNFIAKQINQGRQAFIICPLIEESETIQSKAAIKEFEKLSHQVFPNLKLGLLHGRMSAKEKNNTMLDFKNKKTNILVSTAVIEVGIDIPNASTILIDGAERFGLSQLHQFRGRVGRGEHESYCILLSESKNLEAKERLKILERITDGFELAEEDLKIRGPGDHVGTKQSGLPNLKIANIHDYDILSIARNEAIKIIQKDPELQDLELNMIKNKISEYKQNILIENNYS
ncbi:MAG: ATP-dependent DNA helicase RecG [Chloroflexi bacterium]|nr:ATP-dependent DNA helicase RecG [Chloroflexota bacterium]